MQTDDKVFSVINGKNILLVIYQDKKSVFVNINLKLNSFFLKTTKIICLLKCANFEIYVKQFAVMIL